MSNEPITSITEPIPQTFERKGCASLIGSTPCPNKATATDANGDDACEECHDFMEEKTDHDSWMSGSAYLYDGQE